MNNTYSINQQTQKMEPGKIAWCGITRKNAEIVEVLLDNGEKIRATPDHRFIMRDGTEKEAQFLQSMDSLMPLYLNEAKTSPKQKANHICVTLIIVMAKLSGFILPYVQK